MSKFFVNLQHFSLGSDLVKEQSFIGDEISLVSFRAFQIACFARLCRIFLQIHLTNSADLTLFLENNWTTMERFFFLGKFMTKYLFLMTLFFVEGISQQNNFSVWRADFSGLIKLGGWNAIKDAGIELNKLTPRNKWCPAFWGECRIFLFWRKITKP